MIISVNTDNAAVDTAAAAAAAPPVS